MSIPALAAYLLLAMQTWVPPTVHPEGREKAIERYESIANDIATLALDEHEQPLFAGEDGRAKTAILLASIASFESMYRADVDEGRVRGDNGISWCILQVQVRGKTAEGWTGRDLVTVRQKCLQAGLNKARESFRLCSQLPITYRLSGYTAGTCHEERKAASRMTRGMRWLTAHPLPKDLPKEEAPRG